MVDVYKTSESICCYNGHIIMSRFVQNQNLIMYKKQQQFPANHYYFISLVFLIERVNQALVNPHQLLLHLKFYLFLLMDMEIEKSIDAVFSSSLRAGRRY